MCGHVGVAGDLLHTDIKMFKQLLAVGVLRGAHSTGIAAIDARGECIVHKKAQNSLDFLDNKRVDPLLSATKKAIIGHNRYATSGSITNSTAHPFEHGNITLAHNGTLTSRRGLTNPTGFSVDSENICNTLSLCTQDGVKDVLESLHGAYALVWHDASDDTLHFARNEDRELYFAYAGKVLYWASEKKMLEWILDRNNIDITKTVMLDLPVGEHWYFQMGIDSKFTVEKFTPYEPPVFRNYNRKTPTLGDIGLCFGNKIVFDPKIAQPVQGTYTVEGFMINKPEVKIRVTNVPFKDVLLDDDGDLLTGALYEARVNWISSDGTVNCSQGDIKLVMEDEHHTVKKHLPSFTEESTTPVYIDGVPFFEEELEGVMREGCAMCGSPFARSDLKGAIVDVNEDIFHPECHDQYVRMTEIGAV